MLKIRFSRTGRKNKAQYRVVVQEHTYAPTGRHVEILGNWNPHTKEGNFKNDRIEYWIANGAQVSDSVYNLLVSQGVIKGEKRRMNISSKKKKAEEEGAEEGEKKAEGEEKAEEVKEEAPKEEAKEEEKKEEKTEEKKEEKKKEEVKEEKKVASDKSSDEAKEEKAEEKSIDKAQDKKKEESK